MTLLTATKVKHYFGGLCAVADFNLQLQSGELMGIIGPNGAGKTTIFNLITGVYRASEGSIRLRDVELVGKTPHQITALRVGRTFQNIRLFRDLSVLDNVRIAHYAQVHYSPLEALLHIGRYRREEQRIIDNSHRLLSIFKLEHLAGETAKNLPYGSQRRLEIARALAIDPELLLLDEPAAGMNPNEIDQLMEFIQWIRQEFKLTILLIEHQMKLVMGICERIMVLDFGQTLSEGPPTVIQNDPKVLEAYLGEGSIG
ncbi:MAG TPA: ABC transporter ATP-binding protein [Candidatus Competibacteraceae bacterium]|nr:MAG: ABC transporter ATP-binding protein [Candidatus Competibacteraceae bacterium]HOB62698.1 ABC transporter ATP-binding protein [Candidatus Competibacteraceae bacterium]HQA26317.1 ABC transporter ATP-binding protein [Candidatus Competibacteraceae bacterium]HQD55221.1 ABC transporter ATP-binding protein [Candidatus Competibacteraceae bacterium]